MQAICTKYLGPTNTKGARIKAYTESGLSATVAYDHSLNTTENHYNAVKAFVARNPGTGPAWNWISGGIKGGFAWVNTER